MENWSNKVQRSFNTFVDDIPDQDLKNFVFAGIGGTQDWGSSEYVLKHLQQRSTAYPEGCHIVEVLLHPQTDSRPLQKLARSSWTADNVCAFVLVDPAIDKELCDPANLKKALKMSPTGGTVNKIHIAPALDQQLPPPAPGQVPMQQLRFTPIPFTGLNLDGSKKVPEPSNKKAKNNAAFLATKNKGGKGGEN